MDKKYKTGRANYYKGLIFEYLALLSLIFKGYKLLNRRFKTKLGEIDLIMKKGDTICFVEVKGRSTKFLAGESIHVKNMDRVTQAAKIYLSLNPAYSKLNMTFDAMLFYTKKHSWLPFVLLKFDHIKNAW